MAIGDVTLRAIAGDGLPPRAVHLGERGEAQTTA